MDKWKNPLNFAVYPTENVRMAAILDFRHNILHTKQIHPDTEISSKVIAGLSGGKRSTNCL